MSLDKKIIGGGPALQCGVNERASVTNNSGSLSGDMAVQGIDADYISGTYYIFRTAGQQVYSYNSDKSSNSSANTSGINPQSAVIFDNKGWTYDTYQYTGGGGWKSYSLPGLTETSFGSGGGRYPRAGNNHPYWACKDPLNPNRIYYGYVYDTSVYVTYKADFPSSSRNGYDTGLTSPVALFCCTFDGDYFYGHGYDASGGTLYQMYIGDHKGAAFTQTGVTFTAISQWDYYPIFFYHEADDAYYTQRASKSQTAKSNMTKGPSCTSYPDLNYLCVAGGGGGGAKYSSAPGAGGGAGGLQTSYGSATGGGNDVANGPLELVPGTYTITVGSGGGGAGYNGNYGQDGSDGGNSSIAHPSLTTITSTGGGGGGGALSGGRTGGSGGGRGAGGGYDGAAGIVGQGFMGGHDNAAVESGGGGGASAKGGQGTSGGGTGLSVSITGSAVTYATGGNGNVNNTGPSASTANTGQGGQGSGNTSGGASGASGIVVLRLATSNYSGVTTGSPTVTTSGSDTIIKFTSSGTYVHS